MKSIIALAAMTAAVLATGPVAAKDGDAHAATTPAELERPARFKLVDAAPSVEALIDRVLDAIAKKDVQALERLRLTEEEYRQFVLPGSVEPGKPARVYDETSSKFYWEMNNTNSKYAANRIITNYGGHNCRVKEVRYLKGQQAYAWYEAYKTVNLKLEDEGGKEAELTLGSIANIDGQFKFVSLLGDR